MMGPCSIIPVSISNTDTYRVVRPSVSRCICIGHTGGSQAHVGCAEHEHCVHSILTP